MTVQLPTELKQHVYAIKIINRSNGIAQISADQLHVLLRSWHFSHQSIQVFVVSPKITQQHDFVLVDTTISYIGG